MWLESFKYIVRWVKNRGVSIPLRGDVVRKYFAPTVLSFTLVLMFPSPYGEMWLESRFP